MITQLVLFLLGIGDATLHMMWLIGNVLGLGFALLFYVLAIVSLYISRVFIETQNRPFYVIDTVVKSDE
jgi:hypothetical protein